MLLQMIMKIAVGVGLCFFNWLTISAAPPAKALYPLEVGSRWTYQAGPYELVEEVTQIDIVDGERCARVETRIDGKSVAYEHLAHKADGIYRVTIAGERVVPPLCFLKFPVAPGAQWHVSSQIGDARTAGQFTCGIERLKVPAGDYQAVAIHGTNFQSEGGALEFTYYFAPGVGKVKQVISSNGKSAQLELKKFEPAR